MDEIDKWWFVPLGFFLLWVVIHFGIDVKEPEPIICEEIISYQVAGQSREICYNEGHHYTSLEYSVIRQWKENE